MNQTVISLASVATVGSAMLLWKLLTGEHSPANSEAGQEHQQQPNGALNPETSDGYCAEAGDAAFVNAEQSAGWADASSECADDDSTAESLGAASAARSLHLPERGSPAPPAEQQDDLQASESFVSAASAEDDGEPHEVSSISRQPSGSPSPRRAAPVKSPAAARPASPVAVPGLQSHQQLPGGSAQQLQAADTADPTQPPQPTQHVQGQFGAAVQQQDSPSQQKSAANVQQQSSQGATAAQEDGNPVDHLDSDAGPAAVAEGSRRLKRTSSSEQMVFGPVEPRFAIGGFMGEWQGGISRQPAETVSVESAKQDQYTPVTVDSEPASQANAAEDVDRQLQGEQQSEQAACQDQHQLPGQQLQQESQLQQRKLQPLNYAAADSAMDKQYAMTDTRWATLRTVEVGTRQGESSSEGPTAGADSSLPPVPPRPPSATAIMPAVPPSAALDRTSSSDSEEYGTSAFAIPVEIMSAVDPTSSSENAAMERKGTMHSRHASRARSGSGSLLGNFGDWPSIQLQSSVPEGKADSSSSSAAATAAPTNQQHQPEQHAEPKVDMCSPAEAVADVEPSKQQVAQQQQHVQQGDESPQPVVAAGQQQEHAATQQTGPHSAQPLHLTFQPVRSQQQQDHTAGPASGAPLVQQQQQRRSTVASPCMQQQPAVDLQGPAEHLRQHTAQAAQQQDMAMQPAEPAPVHQQEQQAQRRQQGDDEQPVQQQQHAEKVQTATDQADQPQQQQQLLLQPESTLPMTAQGSSNLSSYTGSLKSRKQQQYWKQLLHQEQQQQQLDTQQPGGLPSFTESQTGPPAAAAPASSRQGSNPTLLQTVEAGGHSQLVTQPTTESIGSSGSRESLDTAMADLAAGLTAPRSWRPSRASHGPMLGTTHSKLSIMTTAADGMPNSLGSSGQHQQRLQTAPHVRSDLLATSSGAGASDSIAEAADSDEGPWLRLVVSSGPAAGRSFHTTNQTAELAIGRSPMSWANIPDQEISGTHACLSWSSSEDCWMVADAGSLNGTSLNGTAISKPGRLPGHPTALKHGDRLDLGSITSAVVQCGTGQQQAAAAAGAAASQGSPVRAIWQQHRQQQGLTDGYNQTLKTINPKDDQQQQQQWASLLTHQQQPMVDLLPGDMQHHQQQQQHLVDSRYNTWTAGHPSPNHAAPSSSPGNHRSSMEYPSAAAATTLRFCDTASSSGNGSSFASSPGSSSRSKSLIHHGTHSGQHTGLQSQVHYRTGGGLSSAGSSSCCQSSPSSPAGGVLAPLMLLQFLDCRIEGAVVKMVGADHRRNHSPCEDVVAWRTPLANWPQVGLFCVFDGHHSRSASEQAQELLPKLLSQHLLPSHHQQQQLQQHTQQPGQLQQQEQQGQLGSPSSNGNHLQQQQQQALLADEPAVAAAFTASFLETDKQLTCDDGCTATAVLLEGCADGSVMMRVANVGDSMAVLIDLSNAGWRSLTEDHRIAGNPAEAARLSAKNHNVPGGVSTRLYGLNIARMLGDRFLKEQDVGFTAEPYVSEGVILGPNDEALLLVASDGLWDVVTQERAAGMAGKIVAERAGLALSSSAGTAAVEADSSAGADSSVREAVGSAQDASGGNSTVAAAVAEALMHTAVNLRSKDDISILALHVLPAAVAGSRAAAVGSVSVSGSI